MIIESFQNEKIKRVSRLLADNRFRKKSGVFAVEGQQENERAQQFGYESEAFFVCEKLFKGQLPEGNVQYVTDKVYEKLAYRGTSEGIIGIYKSREHHLEDFVPAENSAVIIVENAEKPGNLGAILRSCEAFGIDALIVTGTKVDFYNPNVIRSSVGCFFGMNVFQADPETLLGFLENFGYSVFTTFMEETARPFPKLDFTKKSAVLFGTEHSGLSDFWLTRGQNALIPMAGTIDSLNLSNAVAIACYEILRQRSE